MRDLLETLWLCAWAFVFGAMVGGVGFAMLIREADEMECVRRVGVATQCTAESP